MEAPARGRGQVRWWQRGLSFGLLWRQRGQWFRAWHWQRRPGASGPSMPDTAYGSGGNGSSLPSIFTPAEKAKQAASQSLQEKRSGSLDPKTATSILESHGFAGHTPPAYALTSKTNLIAWINRQKAAQTAAQRQAAQRQASKAVLRRVVPALLRLRRPSIARHPAFPGSVRASKYGAVRAAQRASRRPLGSEQAAMAALASARFVLIRGRSSSMPRSSVSVTKTTRRLPVRR